MGSNDLYYYHYYHYYSSLLNYYFSITLSSNPLLPLLHYYFHYSKINSPVWIHLIFTMTGCDASIPPDSEDDASPIMLQLGGQDQTLTNNEMGILPLRRAAAAAAPNSGELQAGWRHLLLLPSEDRDQETMESQFMCLKLRPEVARAWGSCQIPLGSYKRIAPG